MFQLIGIILLDLLLFLCDVVLSWQTHQFSFLKINAEVSFFLFVGWLSMIICHREHMKSGKDVQTIGLYLSMTDLGNSPLDRYSLLCISQQEVTSYQWALAQRTPPPLASAWWRVVKYGFKTHWVHVWLCSCLVLAYFTTFWNWVLFIYLFICFLLHCIQKKVKFKIVVFWKSAAWNCITKWAPWLFCLGKFNQIMFGSYYFLPF